MKERGESEEQDEVSNVVDVANELAGNALKHVVMSRKTKDGEIIGHGKRRTGEELDICSNNS